jgi:hypothetical protein
VLSAKLLDISKAIVASAGAPTMHPGDSKGVEALEAFALWIAIQISLE